MSAFRIFSRLAELLDITSYDLPANNTPLSTALGLKAPLASPTFTGTVTCHTVTCSNMDATFLTGNGSSLTNLNGNNIATGTIAAARIADGSLSLVKLSDLGTGVATALGFAANASGGVMTNQAQRVSRLADDAVSSTALVNLTGMDFALAADTWYKLEIATRYTSGASGLNFNLVTTGTFQTVEFGQGALGVVAANGAIQNAYQNTTTRIVMRGANLATRTNARWFGIVYFKTNAAGTGTIAISLDSGTTTGTSHEVVANLSLF